MKTFGERLAVALKAANDMSHTQLGELVGMSQPGISKIVSGKTKTTSHMNIIKMSKALGVNSHWLATGEGDMRDPGWVEEDSNIRESRLKVMVAEDDDPINDDEFVELPLLNVSLSAGSGSCEIEESSEFALVFRRYYLKKMGVPEDAAKLVRVTGNSMEPTLHDGDVVGVNTKDIDIRDGKTYAICQADLLRVKTLIATPSAVIIRSINRDEYEDEVITRDEFHRSVKVIGKVFWSSHSW